MAAPAVKDVQARLDELRDELNHHLYRYHVLDDPEISDAAYDRLYDELKALEDAARRGASLGQVREVTAPDPDGLARQGDDRRGIGEMGRGRAEASRLGRAGRLRARAEDRRLGDQPRLRGWRLHPRSDAGRRVPGRGRDAELANDQRDSPANAGSW